MESFGETAYRAHNTSHRAIRAPWNMLDRFEQMHWNDIGNAVAERCAHLCDKAAERWPTEHKAAVDAAQTIRECAAGSPHS